jgi:hypothetical protein
MQSTDVDKMHPITPPPELVEEWCSQLFGCEDKPEIAAYELSRWAARWGYQQCWNTYVATATGVVLPQDDFDALQRRLAEPSQYDPRAAKVLSTPAPWDEPCDKTSTSADQ